MSRNRSAQQRPPGPPRGRLNGSLAAYEADRLGFLLELRDQYGGLVSFDSNTTVVNDGQLAKRMLALHATFVVPGNFLNRRLSLSAASSVDPARQHLNAGLRMSAIESLRIMCRFRLTEALAVDVHPSGFLDPLPTLERAISSAVAEFYFGDGAPQVSGLVKELLDALSNVFGNPFSLPAQVPTPANLRVKRSYAALRKPVDLLVRTCLKTGGGQVGYASRVTEAAHAAGHPDSRISDLLIGSLLAAQRVPAAGAAWTLMRLAEMPAASVDEARTSRVALLGVTNEALRLHPPTWLIHRAAAHQLVIDGYSFRKGHNFLISPYVLHRDNAVFADAEEFRPERWARHDAPVDQLFTYGAGIHRCPGRDAGTVAIIACMQLILERFNAVRDSRPVTPLARTTLVPDGLGVILNPRGQCDSQADSAADRSVSTR